MRADPEPNCLIVFHHSQSSIADANAGGIDRRVGMHLPEAQPRMPRILSKNMPGVPGLLSDMRRQFRK